MTERAKRSITAPLAYKEAENTVSKDEKRLHSAESSLSIFPVTTLMACVQKKYMRKVGDRLEAEITKYTYFHNLQGDIVGILDSNGAEVVKYMYDAWGKQLGNPSGTLATTLGQLQPFRYRGYVYDEESELHYLQSRYYSSITCKLISPDTELSGNIYCYCSDNPIHKIDPSGKTEIGYNLYKQWQQYAPIIASADGPYPLMDGIAAACLTVVAGGYIIDGCVALWNLITQPQTKAVQQEQDTTDQKTRSQAYFPENPYDFHPKGLVMRQFQGTRNGKIIKWLATDKSMVFEWDEDILNGSHYHIETHDGNHYWPESAVPEPYNTIYFGR